MNSLQLEKALSTDKYTKRNFIGVYARDELPIKIKYPSCLIVNTHKKTQPGEHWLAIYFDENKNGEFFDSYGYSPAFHKLDKYLNSTCNEWTWNNQRIQGYFSKLCGLYCLFYLYQRCRGIDLDTFQKNFKETDKNDDLILKFIKNK